MLTSALVMQLLDRTAGTNFFSPFGWSVANSPPVVGGGQTLLFQHLFWFYSHPAVYIMILPAMGSPRTSSRPSRQPLFGYKPMVFATAGIAGLGFIVWGHHMFQSGMNPALGATFMLSTMMIALPSAIKVFNWLGTMWGGRIQFTAAMLNAMAFVAMFIIGGLSTHGGHSVDMHIHDTYFIVGHIHYVLFGGSTFGLFAAIYFWFPKMFGRMMNEPLGKLHFVLAFIFFNGTFFLMHIIGMHGHMRRIADPTVYEYLRGSGTLGMNIFMTYCAFGLGLTQLIFAANFVYSLVAGPVAGSNPWKSNTLSGPRRRRRSTTTSRRSRRSTTRPTSTACRGFRRLPPQTEPRPAEAGPLDPSWPDVVPSRPGSPPPGVLEPSMSTTPNAKPRSPETPARPACGGRRGRRLHLAPARLGGLVTTYRVGMAVPDWPTTFGMNMFLYRFWNALGRLHRARHRLFGSALGLAAIVLAAWFVAADRRRWMKAARASPPLLAVIARGSSATVRPVELDDPGGRARLRRRPSSPSWWPSGRPHRPRLDGPRDAPRPQTPTCAPLGRDPGLGLRPGRGRGLAPALGTPTALAVHAVLAVSVWGHARCWPGVELQKPGPRARPIGSGDGLAVTVQVLAGDGRLVDAPSVRRPPSAPSATRRPWSAPGTSPAGRSCWPRWSS